MRMRNGYVMSRDRRNDFDGDHDDELYEKWPRSGVIRDEPLRRRSISPQLVVEGSRTGLGGRRSDSLERMRDNGGSRRNVVKDRRTSSVEPRREYDPDIEGVCHVLSRSPPVGAERVRKRPHYMDESGCDLSPTSLEMRARNDYDEYMDYDVNTRSKRYFAYDNRVEVSKTKDSGARRFNPAWHNSWDESVYDEHDMDGDDGSPQTYGYATIYGEACTYEKGFREISRNYSSVDKRKIENDSIQRRDALSYQKMTKDGYYKSIEKSAYSSRGCAYTESPLSHVKVIGTEDLPKDLPNTSDTTVRAEYQGKPRDVRSLPSDGYSKRSGKAIESLVYDDHGPGVISDTRRVYEDGVKDTKCYTCDCYTTEGPERKGYVRTVARRGGANDPGFSSGGHMYPRMTYSHVENDQRHLLRPDSMDVHLGSMADMECSHSPHRTRKHDGVEDLDVMQKEMPVDYVNMRKSSDVFMQGRGYLDSNYPCFKSKRRVPDHQHITDYGCIHDYETDDLRSEYSYGNDARAGSVRAKLKGNTEGNDRNIQRFAKGSERMKGVEYFSEERVVNRKYDSNEVINKVDSRRGIHGKWHVPSGSCTLHDHDVEWTSREARSLYSKMPSDYEPNAYSGESEKIYDETYYQEDSNDAAWISYENESIPESSGRHVGMGNRHMKAYTKSESLKSGDYVHHSHQRSNRYDQPNLRPRNNSDNIREAPAEDAEQSENFGGPWKHEASEDSDEFKQRAQAAFLDFSKRFNENPTARRLYREDGRAGSLFCVVCRRSASKEFQNTRALATHAFMSHKVGLRPLHLGLHRAICVLMGWNIMPNADLGNWAPEELPPSEALAKKEDLILWPPAVIIHNISLSYNDHNEWKLINIDALGEFLRGKGFHLGKMRICLGNPGDHSVILVKFLGTFSGLQEAERLHKYFLERKHGRIDFQEAISSIGEGSKSEKGSDCVDKLEDVLMYGYMGTSEDLDKVDFDTRKRCSVKSKKEIHDIADAPVKPPE